MLLTFVCILMIFLGIFISSIFLGHKMTELKMTIKYLEDLIARLRQQNSIQYRKHLEDVKNIRKEKEL